MIFLAGLLLIIVAGTQMQENNPSETGHSTTSSRNMNDKVQVPMGEMQEINSLGETSWTGTLCVGINSVSAYDSLAEAEKEHALGTVINSEPPESFGNAYLIVLNIRLTNVDAETSIVCNGVEKPEWFSGSVFAPKPKWSSDTAVASICSLSSTVGADGQKWGWGNAFELPKGSDKSLQIGFWIMEGTNSADLVVSPAAYGLGSTVFNLQVDDRRK